MAAIAAPRPPAPSSAARAPAAGHAPAPARCVLPPRPTTPPGHALRTGLRLRALGISGGRDVACNSNQYRKRGATRCQGQPWPEEDLGAGGGGSLLWKCEPWRRCLLALPGVLSPRSLGRHPLPSCAALVRSVHVTWAARWRLLEHAASVAAREAAAAAAENRRRGLRFWSAFGRPGGGEHGSCAREEPREEKGVHHGDGAGGGGHWADTG